jgi:hypothetical protein
VLPGAVSGSRQAGQRSEDAYAHRAVRSRIGGLDDVIFKLERLDGTPAEPASIETTILSWQPGDTILLNANWDADAHAVVLRPRAAVCWHLRFVRPCCTFV